MGDPGLRNAASGSLPDAVDCPFCGTADSELVNPFGGQLSVAQYWCRRCRTGFEYLKWEDHDDPRRRSGGW